MFEWVAIEGCSLAEVCHRLDNAGVATSKGAASWSRSTVESILKNPAYMGTARFGRTRLGPVRRRLRPIRGKPAQPRRGRHAYRTSPEEQEVIPVPAIVGEAIFSAVQDRLTENKKRYRGKPKRQDYLLQGLIVCKCCGYAYCGSNRVYYRCTGSDRHRFGEERICWNRLIRADRLEAAVWQDVQQLLSDPSRIEQEYQRRTEKPAQDQEQAASLRGMIHKVKRGIARLIDAYEEGVLDKNEFQPRIQTSKERLERLEEEAKRLSQQHAEQEELRLAFDQFDTFARRIREGLEDADWETRRQVVTALVKQVEVEQEQIRVIYRVAPAPVDRGFGQTDLQDCPMQRVTSRRRQRQVV
jgi:site-specific DNA recombinase